MTGPAIGRGAGKVILLGEHAVVYGYPALAAALPGGVELTASWQVAPAQPAAPAALAAPADPWRMRVELPQWQLSLDTGAEPAHPVARALAALWRELGPAAPASPPASQVPPGAAVELALRGQASIWPSAGLGSSAAFTVAAARALAALAAAALDDDAAARAADAAERVFHGKPSGLDVALATAGGAGVFERGRGLTPLHLPPLGLVIGHSGAPRSTADMVARVAERTGGARSDARLVALGAAVERGVRAVAAGDLSALGAAMDAAHHQLAELGVSSPRLDEMCQAARAAGALGAKLTGAGGGGCAIALVPSVSCAEAERVLRAWSELGLATRAVALGAGAPG